MQVLDCEENKDIIGWSADGTAFNVKKSDEVVATLNNSNFKETKYTSFIRKVRLLLSDMRVYHILYEKLSFLFDYKYRLLHLYLLFPMLSSIRVQLYRWGFTRVLRGENAGAFYHAVRCERKILSQRHLSYVYNLRLHLYSLLLSLLIRS